jgi:HEPN domain-containing protein
MRHCERAVSSSTPEGTKQAAVLARKADADAIAVRELVDNPEITDEIVGFHAQQAIEKWLKALMASRGMDEARIHDIGRLLQLLENDGAQLPDNAERLDDLTIYAVPMRYDELLDAEPLDRESTVELIDEVDRWARNALNS